MASRLITITFEDNCPVELCELIMERSVPGIELAYGGKSKNIVHVKPAKEKYLLLREQLSVWEREGALSFVEEP